MIYLAIKTGMRQGELFALMWMTSTGITGKSTCSATCSARSRMAGRSVNSAPQDGHQLPDDHRRRKNIDVLKTHRQDVALKKALAGKKWKKWISFFRPALAPR